MTTTGTRPRFVLLDHSLTGLVGHHYAYAWLLLEAARDAGYRPVLAANRQLGELDAGFPAAEVHRPFRHTTYTRHTYDADHRPGIATPFVRAARIRSFAAGCARLFREVTLEDGDVVFAATMSELDFAGLSRWLAAAPVSLRASWHVQFHLNLFRGREDDYASQEPLAAKVRSVLGRALAPLARHRLRLRCTTESLVRQYERLGVASFKALAYPIDEAFLPRSEAAGESTPIRVALLGHGRKEKGTPHVQRLVNELWEPHLRTGRVQLVVQARPGKLHLALPGKAGEGVEPVAFAPAGLSRDRYVALVRDTDVGLLLYDAERYYTRCSGVLLEMLCSGVSVLVPAASWLSEQLAEPVQLHLDALAAAHAPEAAVASSVRFDHDPAKFELAVRQPAHDLLVSCAPAAPLPPGTFLAVEARQRDASGDQVSASLHVLDPRPGGRPARALLRIAEQARVLELSLRNAFAHAPVALDHLGATPVPKGAPAGAVGLIAADVADASTLIRELIEQHGHYQQTAAAFAVSCRQRHGMAEVLRQLLAH